MGFYWLHKHRLLPTSSHTPIKEEEGNEQDKQEKDEGRRTREEEDDDRVGCEAAREIPLEFLMFPIKAYSHH